MRIVTLEQRTPEWVAARLGRLTSSCAADMLATRKDKKEASDRRNLRIRLTLERITGRSHESSFVSDAMRVGMERESAALLMYEGLTGRFLQTTGFVAHDTLMAGCSPDAHVNDFEGLVEAKSPLAATHLSYLRSGLIPSEYLQQVHHQMFITGARWCDWLSFNPDFPEALQTKLVRVDRDEGQMKAYELIVRQFLAEVDREVEDVQRLVGAAA